MSGESILNKAAISLELKPVTFGTGSDGFRGQGKVMDGGEKYQVQVTAVRCGSKPKAGK